jgi:hypothetical protein
LRGVLPEPFLQVFLLLCDCISDLAQPVFDPEQAAAIELKVRETMSLFELYYPRSELTIVFHLMLHLAMYQQLWGRLPRLWMFGVERFLGFLARRIKNRAKPEANLMRVYRHLHAVLGLRPDIEAAVSRSEHSSGYSRFLDSGSKVSPSGPAVTARRFSSMVTPEGPGRNYTLTDAERKGLFDFLVLHHSEFGALARKWQAAVDGEVKDPRLAAWRPAAGLTERERRLQSAPANVVVSYPRATVGGVTYSAAKGDAGSARSRYARVAAHCRLD